MSDPSYGAKVYEKQGGDEIVVASGGKITEESGGAILGRTVLNADMADSGTAGSAFVVCPFAGTLVGLAAVNHVANTTTKTVLTAKITGAAVTIPAWEIAVTAAAGTATAVVPTAANTVVAGDVIEFISDGGSATASQKTTFTATVLRSS
jgi:hypothetical protein